jgi:hypothetical protein
MERYRAAQGSNDFSCTMHALAAGPAGKLQFTPIFFLGDIPYDKTSMSS